MTDKTDKLVAKITHYFDKIGVAVFDVEAGIKVGDKLKFVGKEDEFEQVLSSMQVEHQNVQGAKPGDHVGVKVDQPVKEGDEVFKVE